MYAEDFKWIISVIDHMQRARLDRTKIIALLLRKKLLDCAGGQNKQLYLLGGMVASWLASSIPDQAVRAGVIVFFTLTVPLLYPGLVYKWVPTNMC